MKFMIVVFKNVITPISSALMLLIGALAAILSGVVEYYVLRDFFSKITINGTEKEFSFIPMVIVVVLEGSKIFLHFGNSAIKQNLTNDNRSAHRLAESMNKIKVCLIVFSFVCTVIFTCNFLYQNTSFNMLEEQTNLSSQIDTEYDEKIKALEKEYIEKNKLEIDSKKKEWEQASKALSDLQPRLTPKVVYDRYIQERDFLQKYEQKKHDEYQDSLNKDIHEDPTFQLRLETVNKERNNKKENALKESSENVENDNECIRTFLLFIFNSILNKYSYPKVLYFIVVLAISLVIAAILEAVIFFSQRLITMPAKELEKAFEADYEAESEIKARIKFLARVIIGAVISFFVFLVYGLIKEITMDRFEIVAGLGCSFLTVLMGFALPKFHYTTPETIEKGKKNRPKTNGVLDVLGEFMVTEGRIMIIKAILSFVCFVFLGILFEESISEITVPAIGVAIGGAIGHIFHITPKSFSLSSV